MGVISMISLLPVTASSQDLLKGSEVHGSMQMDAAYYLRDTKMGITDSTLGGKLIRMNAFTEVNYSLGNFTAGMRFEAYLPPLTGYDAQYNGAGVPYWYANYKNDFIDITAGNFYEQFGNGMILRTYQEWTLGVDNSIQGVRIKVMPFKGVTFKGVYGIQRYYWDPYKDYNRGIIKGFDGDFNLNELFAGMAKSKVKLTLGGSFVSDFQQGKTSSTEVGVDSTLIRTLPENVANFGGRFNLNIGGFNWQTEYAHKINDPNARNNYIYKDGNGVFTNLSWSQKGLGIQVMSKWIDNMSYKSDRSVVNNMVDINYLPAITKQHTYALASMYPYATQPNGEVGISGTVTVHFPKNSPLGGKTGLAIAANFSQVNSIKQEKLNDSTLIGQTGTLGYKSTFYGAGNELYYQDANLEVSKKFSKKWKGAFTYLHQAYNKDVVEGHVDQYGIVYSHIGVADLAWSITPKHNLRWELQGLWTKQDKGNWVAGLVELTISPAWFFSVMDQYNYGNSDHNQRLNYYLLSAGYTRHTSRIALSWGRQREGIICVGGVCRYVPATNGVTLTLTSSF